jgi:hypothetical protein
MRTATVPDRRGRRDRALALASAGLISMALILGAATAAHASAVAPHHAPPAAVSAQDLDGNDGSDGVPKWVWATLVMTGFVALSAVTMFLARGPLRHPPPPVQPTDEVHARGEDDTPAS